MPPTLDAAKNGVLLEKAAEACFDWLGGEIFFGRT
jgi:hypothetical protein